MFSFLKKQLTKAVPQALVPKDPRVVVKGFLAKGDCPCCESLGCLLEGPAGGMSVNVMCSKCGSRFNIASFFGANQIIAEFTHGPQPNIWGGTKPKRHPAPDRVRWVEEALSHA